MSAVADTKSTDPRERYRAAFASVERELPGAALPWLRRARRTAMGRFEALGFPGARDEDWKYTHVAPIEKRAFKAASSMSCGASAADIDRWALDGAHRFVFVNGRYTPTLSTAEGLPRGARVETLAAAIFDGEVRLEPLLGHAEAFANGFEALNAALWHDGIYIELAPGVAIDKPIHLLFVASEADLATHACTIVKVGAGSRLRIVEHHVGPDGIVGLTNAMTLIVLEASARVEHCKLQEESLQGFHISTIDVRQSGSSTFASCSFALGAALSRTAISTRFDGPGCQASLDGLYVVGGRQHVDHHTSIDHATEGGTSREHYRGVLDGKARAVFNGKVIVRPDARRTDAHQSNRNLLLSEGAEVDTKPQLEIFADDVKCTHGATVGALDDQAIFYLRSRGIGERRARSMLTFAFAEDIVARCEITAARERVRALLSARLASASAAEAPG